jgi:hypothetical protein
MRLTAVEHAQSKQHHKPSEQRPGRWSRFSTMNRVPPRSGLIAAGISVAIIAVVNALGSQLQTTFSTVTSDVAAAGK